MGTIKKLPFPLVAAAFLFAVLLAAVVVPLLLPSRMANPVALTPDLAPLEAQITSLPADYRTLLVPSHEKFRKLLEGKSVDEANLLIQNRLRSLNALVDFVVREQNELRPEKMEAEHVELSLSAVPAPSEIRDSLERLERYLTIVPPSAEQVQAALERIAIPSEFPGYKEYREKQMKLRDRLNAWKETVWVRDEQGKMQGELGDIEMDMRVLESVVDDKLVEAGLKPRALPKPTPTVPKATPAESLYTSATPPATVEGLVPPSPSPAERRGRTPEASVDRSPPPEPRSTPSPRIVLSANSPTPGPVVEAYVVVTPPATPSDVPVAKPSAMPPTPRPTVVSFAHEPEPSSTPALDDFEARSLDSAVFAHLADLRQLYLDYTVQQLPRLSKDVSNPAKLPERIQIHEKAFQISLLGLKRFKREDTVAAIDAESQRLSAPLLKRLCTLIKGYLAADGNTALEAVHKEAKNQDPRKL